MAAAAIATLSLSSSVPCKKQPRLGGSSFSAREFGGSSSRWHTINLRSRAPAPRPRTAKNRVIVARAGSYKVAILGAAGGVGQPLSLLVKMSPFVSTLHLYDDAADVKGVATDLSHCNTPAQVSGFTGRDELAGSLDGADVVVVTAGAPRTKPGATTQDDDDLFSANAGVVMELVEAVADHAPGAMVHVVSEPVNSTVPLAAEVLRRKGAYDPRKLFGVTTHAVVRANALVAARKGLPLANVDVPVVGGGSDGTTVLPLLSKARPKASFTDEEAAELTARIRNDGAEAGGAPLSTAYAAARFLEASLRGLNGDGGVYECAYVQSQVVPELPFFVCRVRLGRDGVEEVVAEELKGLTDYETRELEALKPELKASIDRGIAYVQQQPTTAAFN